MKLTNTKEIRTMPFKKLFTILEKKTLNKKTIAVICSRNLIGQNSLGSLDDYLILDVDDTLVEESRYAFKPCDGEKVRKFLEENNDFESLFVCCDSGESRSTALAAAILRYFGRSDMEIWKNPYFHPNMLVYRNQLLAFGIKITKLKMLYLKYINDRA